MPSPTGTFDIILAGSVTGSWLSPPIPYRGEWFEFGWTGSTPANTSIFADLYDADTGSLLLSGASNPQSLSGAALQGKTLKVQVSLASMSGGSSPVVSDFYLAYRAYGQATIGSAATVLDSLQSYEVSKTKNLAAGNYSLSVRDPQKTVFNTFRQGDEVQIYQDSWGSGTATKVFGGYVDVLEFDATDRHRLWIKGRDYSGKLQQYAVSRTYSGVEVGSIVRELVGLVPELSGGQISGTSTTVTKVDFNQTTVFDAVKKLADLVDYDFWVDVNKVVYFQPGSYVRNTARSLAYLDNVLDFQKGTDSQDQYNVVTVNGRDEVLSKLDTFIGNGSTKNFQLAELPISPLVKVQDPSGTTLTEFQHYDVNYGAGNIFFAAAPAGSAFVDYRYKRPVTAQSQDATSINLYGRKEKVLYNDSILNRTDAQTYSDSYLTAHKNPKTIYKIKALRADDLEPRDTATVYFPYFNVSGTLETVSIKHAWEPGRRSTEVMMGEIQPEFTQMIGDINTRLQNLENSYLRGAAGAVSTLTQTETASWSGTTWGRNYARSGTGIYSLSTYRGGDVYGSQVSGGATFWSGAA